MTEDVSEDKMLISPHDPDRQSDMLATGFQQQAFSPSNRIHPNDTNAKHLAQEGFESDEEQANQNISQDGFTSLKVLPKQQEDFDEAYERQDARTRFNVANFELERSKDYQKHLSFQVPLERIYQLDKTFKYNKNSIFAAVLLRIVDEQLLNLESNQSKDGVPYQFLLQIWSRDGMLVFQRKLVDRPSQWNLTGKLLLFKEDSASNTIFAVKLSLTNHAVLFEVKMPFDRLLQNNNLADKAEKTILGFTNGIILVAVGQFIFYVDISKQISTEKGSRKTDINPKQEYHQSVEVKLEDIRQLDVDDQYRILSFSEMSGQEVTKKEQSQLMVTLEQTSDHQLVFLKLMFEPQLKLVNLNETHSQLTSSENNSGIKKFFSIISMRQGKPYHMCVVLRENGFVEFYYGFQWKSQECDTLIDDIDFDFNYIYLKGQQVDDSVSVYRINHIWRARISLQVAKTFTKKGADCLQAIEKKWSVLSSKRVSSYMKVYQSFVCQSQYLFFAHRNFVSIFDISKQGWRHIEYNDSVRYVGNTTITTEKNVFSPRSKEKEKTVKYLIAVIVGLNQIHHLDVDDLEQQNAKIIYTDGMIHQYFRDELRYQGIYLLTDNQKIDKLRLFQENLQNSYNNYYLCWQPTQVKYQLSILCEKAVWPILRESSKEASDLLTKDSSFAPYSGSRTPDSQVNMLMIFNPVTSLASSFELQAIEAKEGFKGFKLEKVDCSFSAVLPECAQSDKLQGVSVVESSNKKSKDPKCLVIATENHFYVHNGENFKYIFSGYKNGGIRFTGNQLYVISGTLNHLTVKNANKGTEVAKELFQTAGLYFFDLDNLIKGKFPDQYKIQSALVGINNDMCYSMSAQSVVYIQNMEKAVILPYVHQNIINLDGSSQKDQYLIWREKGGFFTAMNKDGVVQTWSLATGKKLYDLPLPEYSQKFKDYNVYRADRNDVSYDGDRFNFHRSSLSLIMSNKPKNDEIDTARQLSMSDKRMEKIQKQKSEIRHSQSQKTQDIPKESKPFNVYNFQLLEMFSHLDCPSQNQIFAKRLLKNVAINNAQDEEVKVVFEFDFDILENLTEDQIATHSWNTVTRPTQHIYISADRKKLLEIINWRQAVIYDYNDNESVMVDGHKKIFWHKRQIIKRFPLLLQGLCTINFIFSGNFKYYLDFDWARNGMCIMETETQKVFCEIPSDMLNFTLNDDVKDINCVPQIGKRICFYKSSKENLIRIINSENVDCVFAFNPGYFKLQSYAKIDNDLSPNSPHHIIQQQPLTSTHTCSRFIRKFQNYKCTAIHEYNLGASDSPHRLDLLYSVDYNSEQGLFYSQLSFSILSWKIAERLIYEDGFNLDQVNLTQALTMLFCIFPKSWTILHKLCNNSDSSESEWMGQQITYLFNIAKAGLPNQIDNFEKGTKFEVPFLLDHRGNTPLDLALNIDNRKWTTAQTEQAADKEFVDVNLAKILLENLKDQSFLNQGQFMVDSVIQCIMAEVPGIFEFLESRFRKIKCLPDSVENELKEEVQDKMKEITYGVVDSEAWGSLAELKTKMYVEEGWNEQYKNFCFDIPFLHAKGPAGFEFISALEKTEGVECYKHASVQMLVNYHWKTWQPHIYGLRLFPFTLLLIAFTFWSNYILINIPNPDDQRILLHKNLLIDIDPPFSNVTDSFAANTTDFNQQNSTLRILESDDGETARINRFKSANIFLSILIIVISSFFLLIEFDSFIDGPVKYLMAWKQNLFDLTPLILLYINCSHSIRKPGNLGQTFWTLQSITAVLIWFKFIWFLRSQEFFAYLIRSLVETVYDIQAFFIILIIACVGFADAFMSYSRSMKDGGFLDNYYQSIRFSWLFLLGANDSIENINVYGDILYFFGTCVLLIVMLNVLIALAGGALERAQESKTEYAYKEKVQLLYELQQSSFTKLIRFFSTRAGARDGEEINNLLFVSCTDEIRPNAAEEQEQGKTADEEQDDQETE